MAVKRVTVSCLLLLLALSVSQQVFAQKYQDVNNNPKVNIRDENTRPIVGILAQEFADNTNTKFTDGNYTSYIAASYIKFVEGAGGRAVPIRINREPSYYKDLLSKINAVLIPGGSAPFTAKNGYAEAGRQIFELAKELNDQGTYFPVWGTCLGFELLIYLSAGVPNSRTRCSSETQALPLDFKLGFKFSRLFGEAPNDVIHILRNYPVTANNHMYCYTEKTFKDLDLHKYWKVLSVNRDWDGLQFISSVEHKKYPFYGVQFHPEKNIYEFAPNRNVTHTTMSIHTSQYFADFLLKETRKNSNHFPTLKEENDALIYNYSPKFTGAVGSAFEQEYMFEDQL